MTDPEATALAVPHGVELRPLVIPQSLDAADVADFVAMVEIRNAVYREINGHDDESHDAEEVFAVYQDRPYERNLIWLVLAHDEPVGRVILTLPFEEGSRVAFLSVELLRRAWGRGIGSAALELLEALAAAARRTVLQGWASHHTDGASETLIPPTGFGTIPRDHVARFLEARGYALEQIERNSALPLTAQTYEHIETLLAEATRAATGYRIVQWTIPTPSEFVDGYAWMKSRMITDTPAAAIEFDEEVWNAARVADHERPYLETGRTLQVTAAQHIVTGELCAFNELVIGSDRTEATHQEDTLVLADHRGHRLGMLVKCAALHHWRSFAPDSPRVLTYNAEENRPMLDINERMGFNPIAHSGVWKKTVMA